MIRTDEEYIYIVLNKSIGFITEDGCELDALKIENGVLQVSHQLYNVSFQHDVKEGYEDADWVMIQRREDKLYAEEILHKIRESDGPKPSKTKLSLVEQLKRNEDKMKGDLEDSHNLRMKDFLAKNDDF